MEHFVSLSHGLVNYTGNTKLVQFQVLNVTKGMSQTRSINIDINLQRMYFYHLAATYLPTTCLLLIAEITLFIDDSHFEATIMVSLTSMLVLYTLYQSVAVSLPQTAYLKMIDIWLLFGLVMPFLVFLLEVFFELFKEKKKKIQIHENNKVRKIVKTTCSFSKVQNEKKFYFQIDNIKKICQITVPAVTISFIFVYWGIALFHYYLIHV
jgi:hypothetical protein